MSYVRLINGTVAAEADQLPGQARRLDNGAWVRNLPDAAVDEQQATGWYQVTPTARPTDTATTTYERQVTLNGQPSETWVPRDKTIEEQIRERAAQHLANLRLISATTGALTATQLSNAARALADADIDTIRLLNRLELV